VATALNGQLSSRNALLVVRTSDFIFDCSVSSGIQLIVWSMHCLLLCHKTFCQKATENEEEETWGASRKPTLLAPCMKAVTRRH